MTNGQLIEILKQYPSSLDIAVFDGGSGRVKRCTRVADISICDNGISQEYILLSYATGKSCLEPVGSAE